MWGGFVITNGNFFFGEDADLFLFMFLSCCLCHYISCIMASEIILFLFGGIYLQQYLSELFQSGLPPTDCVHPMIAQTGAKYLFCLGWGFGGLLSLAMTCDVYYVLCFWGLNEGLGRQRWGSFLH